MATTMATFLVERMDYGRLVPPCCFVSGHHAVCGSSGDLLPPIPTKIAYTLRGNDQMYCIYHDIEDTRAMAALRNKNGGVTMKHVFWCQNQLEGINAVHGRPLIHLNESMTPAVRITSLVSRILYTIGKTWCPGNPTLLRQ